MRQALEMDKQALLKDNPTLTLREHFYGVKQWSSLDEIYILHLSNLAWLYALMGSYEKAEPLFQDALEIRKKVLGEDNPTYATSLNNLALLYQSMGQYQRAEPLFQHALEIMKSVVDDQHDDAT